MKILLIEDNPNISSALKQALANSYSLDTVTDGASGIKGGASEEYEALVLDMNLPDMKGTEVCVKLRAQGITKPILIISGDHSVLTKIAVLDAGANDYLTKPFSLGELKARLRVLARQVIAPRPFSQILCAGDLILNSATHEVTRDDNVISLRKKEFTLLECLLQNAGTVVTRQALMHYAWTDGQDPWTNTVDVHIKYLRDKIDRPYAYRFIKTVHGLGYKLEAPYMSTLSKSENKCNQITPASTSFVLRST